MHNNYQQQCIEKSRPIWLSMARKAVSGVPINDIASEFGVTDVWVRRSAERINRGLQCMPRLTPWQFDRDYRSYAQMKKALSVGFQRLISWLFFGAWARHRGCAVMSMTRSIWRMMMLSECFSFGSVAGD